MCQSYQLRKLWGNDVTVISGHIFLDAINCRFCRLLFLHHQSWIFLRTFIFLLSVTALKLNHADDRCQARRPHGQARPEDVRDGVRRTLLRLRPGTCKTLHLFILTLPLLSGAGRKLLNEVGHSIGFKKMSFSSDYKVSGHICKTTFTL